MCLLRPARSTFNGTAKACNPLLGEGATAAFTDVPVYLMVTKVAKPMTPAVLSGFRGLMQRSSQGDSIASSDGGRTAGNTGPDTARVSVAASGAFGDLADLATVGGTSVNVVDTTINFVDTLLYYIAILVGVPATLDRVQGIARTELQWARATALSDIERLKDDAASGLVSGLYQIKDMAASDLGCFHDKLRTHLLSLRKYMRAFCGVTFVAHGPGLTLRDCHGNVHNGTLDSTLLWTDGLAVLPRFLHSTLPFNTGVPGFGAPAQPPAPGAILPDNWFAQAVDVLQLLGMCFGPDKAAIPVSVPGSLQLDLSEY